KPIAMSNSSGVLYEVEDVYSYDFSSRKSLSQLTNPHMDKEPTTVPNNIFLIFISVQFLECYISTNCKCPISRLASITATTRTGSNRTSCFRIQTRPAGDCE